MIPKGIRLNNPGNIEQSNTPWKGKIQSIDARFEQFSRPEYGIRALAKTLLTYQDKHGIRTVRGAIYRWAPPSENNSLAYAQHVAAVLGVDLDDQIDFHREAILLPIVMTIIKHENGQQPYSAAVLRDGVEMALEVA
jgi:hypothetical protein